MAKKILRVKRSTIVPPANTVAPSITGTAQVGEVLTASSGTWLGFPAPTFTRQWRKAGADIAGATASTYTPVVGDIGATLACVVLATNIYGTAGATTAASAAVIAAAGGIPPTNTALPVITGTAQVGQTLTVSSGTWTGSPAFTRQWKRAGADIAGATGTTYAPVTGDVGATLTCVVTGTNAGGSVAVTTAATAAVLAAAVSPPVNTAVPTITGTAQVGQTLTVSNGTWTGSPTFTRQWKKAGVSIAGATGTTYVPVAGDVGASILCSVTGTNAGGSATANTAAVVVAAAGAAPTNTVLPVITGTAQVGQTLSVSNGTWTGSPTFARQWKKAGVSIAGATGATYVPVVGDVGATLTCAVTGSNAGGSVTANTAATAAVTAAPPAGTGRLITTDFFATCMFNGSLADYPTVYQIGTIRPSGPRWHLIETTPNNYSWGALDAEIDKAQTKGLLRFIYAPMAANPCCPSFYKDPAGNWPLDFQKLTNFYAAMKARYDARNPTIQIYIDLFNESYYQAITPAKLVQFANATRAALPQNRVMGPDMYGRGSWPAFFDAYWTAGGRKDIFALTIHGYPAFSFFNGQNVPEALEDGFPGSNATFETLKALVSKHGLGGLPWVDTEVSWGTNSSWLGQQPNTMALRAAFTARNWIIHMKNFMWTLHYAHPDFGEDWGTLENTAAEVATKAVQEWALGKRHVSYVKSGSIRTATFSRDSDPSWQGLAKWDFGSGNGYTGSSSYTIPAGFNHWYGIDRVHHPVVPGNVITLDMNPKFITTGVI